MTQVDEQAALANKTKGPWVSEFLISDGLVGVNDEVKPEPSASCVEVLVDCVLVERVQEEVTLVEGAGWRG